MTADRRVGRNSLRRAAPTGWPSLRSGRMTGPYSLQSRPFRPYGEEGGAGVSVTDDRAGLGLDLVPEARPARRGRSRAGAARPGGDAAAQAVELLHVQDVGRGQGQEHGVGLGHGQPPGLGAGVRAPPRQGPPRRSRPPRPTPRRGPAAGHSPAGTTAASGSTAAATCRSPNAWRLRTPPPVPERQVQRPPGHQHR